MTFGGTLVRAAVVAAITLAAVPAGGPAAHADLTSTRCTPSDARDIFDPQVVARKALRTESGRRYGVVRVVVGHRSVEVLGAPGIPPDQRVVCVDLRVDDRFAGRKATVVSRLAYGRVSTRRHLVGQDDVLHDPPSTAGLRTGTKVTLRVRVEGRRFEAVKRIVLRYPKVSV